MKKNHLIPVFNLLSLLIAFSFLSNCSLSDNSNLPVQSRFASATDLKSLATGFNSPPDNTRAWVYWYVMDGNLTREGITADLEAMKRAGIGGAILLEIDQNVPRGNTLMMSQAWIDHFKFIHEEASRLEIEITLNSGPGWTGTGGPWIKPDDAMHFIVADTLSIKGGGEVKVLLPQAKPLEPYFSYVYKITPEMDSARKSYYIDVITLAYPKPKNGLSVIPNSANKAMYTPDAYTPVPYITAPATTTLDKDQCIDISQYVNKEGVLDWNAPDGEWLVYRFGLTLTGMHTIPAPKSTFGFECSKFDTSALNRHFEAYLEPLIKATGMKKGDHKAGWNSLHMDSWEMCTQNWGNDFADQFKKRRGYDIMPYLATITGAVVGSREISERFLFDYRLTAQELILENYIQHLKNAGERYGLSFSNEAYGMLTVNPVAYGAIADVPMCEFWTDDAYNMWFSVLQATSSAHLNNKPIVGAESFTSICGFLKPDTISWRMNPGNMKNMVDWAYSVGINRLDFHTYVFQPWLDKYPGMTMGGIGIHYQRTQTWWELSRAWHDYLARCQYMLRQGQPVADILYLMKEGAPESFAPPADALQGTAKMPYRKGYNFDGCDPGTLINKAKVRDGKISFPGGMEYSILVMPNSETMTPSLLKKIESLIKEGATVVGFAPQKSPGLTNYPRCDAEVANLSREIWKELAIYPGSRNIGKGKLMTPEVSDTLGIGYNQQYAKYANVSKILMEMGIQPDFESSISLRSIHKKSGSMEIFMISNPLNKAVEANCVFRIKNKKASLWNAVNTNIAPAIVTSTADGRSEITLKLDADGSVFVVFSDEDNKKVINTNSTWPKLQEEDVLKGPWFVQFQKKRGAPDSATFENLIDWSTSSTNGIKYFSGIAEYSNTFEIPGETLKGQDKIYIDLGRVAVMAAVTINGKPVAELWKAPFVCEITKYVKAGNNVLKIAVANEWPNRIVGDLFVPEKEKITFCTFSNITKEYKLLPSGLIGPVRILHSTP
jgi:hypothetical protein